MKKLTLGSLFDGIGGFPLAAQRCGIKTLWADEWTRYSYTGAEIKDTPRYTALGNSLAVPCAERVFRGIISAIGGGLGIELR